MSFRQNPMKENFPVKRKRFSVEQIVSLVRQAAYA